MMRIHVWLLSVIAWGSISSGLAWPQGIPGPTAEEVKTGLEKYRQERAEAVKAKIPSESLTRADESARRAEAALAGGHIRSAVRLIRDARWQLPYTPPGLPPHVIRVLGESRLRHADRVNAVAFSPDGSKLASASRDGTAKIWDLANGRELLSYRGHRDTPVDPRTQANVLRLADIAFSPDGKSIATVCENELHVWNAQTGETIAKIIRKENPEKPFKALAFSPDGESIAVGGDDQVVRVYHIEAGKPTFVSPPQTGRIEGVAFAPNGKLVGSVNNAGQLVVYCPGQANPVSLGTPVSNTGEVYDVVFTPDSSGLLTAGKDHRVRLTAGPGPDGQTTNTTAQTLREYVGHTDAVRSVDISRDGKLMVTGGVDRTVRIWEVSSGKLLRTYQGHQSEVVAVAISPDGRSVASGAEDGSIRLWELSTTDDHQSVADAGDALWTVAYSPDGQHLATAGADRIARIYTTSDLKLKKALPSQASAITSLIFLGPDRLALAGGDRVVRIYKLDGSISQELKGHESAILALTATADGRRLISAGADRSVRQWDVENGREQWSHQLKSAVCAVALRGDARIAAVGCADGNVVVLDVSGPSPKELASLSAHVAGVSATAFDAEGFRLATSGGDGLVRLWTIAEDGALTPLLKFEGQPKPGTTSGYSPISTVAFSPDGRFLVSGGADQIVHIWDVQTKSESRGLRAHGDWVTSVAFSPDGRYLASASADRTARVFELMPQDTPPPGHTQMVRAVAVSADGRLAATASTDRTIKIWNLLDGQEVATLLGAQEKIYSISFLGPDRLVSGGELPTGDAGRVQMWSLKPPKALAGTQTGRAWAVLGHAEGSKAVAWTTRPAIGEQANHTYELFDGQGTNVGSVRDSGREILAATFSSDLSWALSADKQGSVRIWDLNTKQRVGADWAVVPQAIADLGITPDKQHLIVVDEAGTVHVAAVATRKSIGSAEAHKAGINGVVVSPKGDTFLTLGADGELKAWSVKEVKMLRSWKCPVIVWGAAYSPDGKTVVTANGDGTAYVLDMPTPN